MLSKSTLKTLSARYADMLIHNSKARVEDIPGFTRAIQQQRVTMFEEAEIIREIKGQGKQLLADSGYPQERLDMVFQR